LWTAGSPLYFPHFSFLRWKWKPPRGFFSSNFTGRKTPFPLFFFFFFSSHRPKPDAFPPSPSFFLIPPFIDKAIVPFFSPPDHRDVTGLLSPPPFFSPDGPRVLPLLEPLFISLMRWGKPPFPLFGTSITLTASGPSFPWQFSPRTMNKFPEPGEDTFLPCSPPFPNGFVNLSFFFVVHSFPVKGFSSWPARRLSFFFFVARVLPHFGVFSSWCQN